MKYKIKTIKTVNFTKYFPSVNYSSDNMPICSYKQVRNRMSSLPEMIVLLYLVGPLIPIGILLLSVLLLLFLILETLFLFLLLYLLFCFLASLLFNRFLFFLTGKLILIRNMPSANIYYFVWLSIFCLVLFNLVI